jgi:hypothetical protein
LYPSFAFLRELFGYNIVFQGHDIHDMSCNKIRRRYARHLCDISFRICGICYIDYTPFSSDVNNMICFGKSDRNYCNIYQPVFRLDSLQIERDYIRCIAPCNQPNVMRRGDKMYHNLKYINFGKYIIYSNLGSISDVHNKQISILRHRNDHFPNIRQ